MDYRVLLAAVVGLVLIAVGGFYFAFMQRPHYAVTPPSSRQETSSPQSPAGPLGKATAESIEAEIARTDQAELQELLKRHFNEEYKELIAVAVRRRNEGVSDEEFGRELFAQFQTIMRPKLQFAVAASMQAIDRLAANEISLFRALGTAGAAHCLTVLGKDDAVVSVPMPDDVRRLMRLGTLYRFQAIVDGMPKFRPLNALNANEMAAFEAGLARSGVSFEEMRTGAFLNQPGEPGAACQKIERMYQTIATLGEETRRKLYSGMFFMGRDK
jgi:hypothetical protein